MHPKKYVTKYNNIIIIRYILHTNISLAQCVDNSKYIIFN